MWNERLPQDNWIKIIKMLGAIRATWEKCSGRFGIEGRFGSEEDKDWAQLERTSSRTGLRPLI